MSDENKKADDNTEKKLEATKKPATKKKAKAKSSKETESEGSKNKVIEKLQAMGVMSGGAPSSDSIDEKNDSGKGEFLKIAAASAVAVLVVGSFVWALDKEASNDRAASKFNNAPHSNPYAMQSNYPSQWGPSSMNQNNGAPHGNNRKNYENQQQRMKQHREQQQKWMQQQQNAFEQQQVQRQKWMKQQRTQQQPYSQNPGQQQIPAHQQQWMDQQKKANADYQALQQKWFNQQRAPQQVYPQNPMQQNIPANQQQWIEQQRVQQKRMQEQQRAQQQKWREQAFNSYPPQMNHQGQPMSPAYNNGPSYQQPTPYNYNGR